MITFQSEQDYPILHWVLKSTEDPISIFLCICVWVIIGFQPSCDLNRKDYLSLSNQSITG